jgi:hypothetical protein
VPQQSRHQPHGTGTPLACAVSGSSRLLLTDWPPWIREPRTWHSSEALAVDRTQLVGLLHPLARRDGIRVCLIAWAGARLGLAVRTGPATMAADS